ncbi:MAG: hypothetical protein N3D11_18185, partial [Candidatus Sumerlaeia bacterium]|nr:hypothetical protein [Candidatus Sumerlaeia bacterium]
PQPFESNALLFNVHAAEGYGLYQFYSYARDHADHVEAAPLSADAQTTVTARSTGSTSSLRWPAYR